MYTNDKLFDNARERTEYALRCFCRAKNIHQAALMRDRLFHELCYGVQKDITKTEVSGINTTDSEILIKLAKVIYEKNTEIMLLREKIETSKESKTSKKEEPPTPSLGFFGSK